MPQKKSRILDGANGKKLKVQLETKLNELNDLFERNSRDRKKALYKIKTVPLLESVAFGLYVETEKLFKKSPVHPATNLIVEQVNQVIKETKEIIEGDPYVARLKEFVPAGSNPEIQDVVIVLKQIMQGLVRYKKKPSDKLKSITNQKNVMEIIRDSLTTLLDDNEELTKIDFGNASYYSVWFVDKSPYPFNFNKLAVTDLYDLFGYSDENNEDNDDDDLVVSDLRFETNEDEDGY